MFYVLNYSKKVPATSDPVDPFPPLLSSRQVRLEWPTDLAINPMDNSIYVLDNNVVLQITENGQVLYF